ncbi:MAG: sporulation protein YtfJ [Ruminococcaceae bacterium]|nr:sporulation protein YtfJ [Oscillospiraceae bacterium]
MNENRMSEIIEASVNSLKSMVSGDTVIGEPINTDNGTTVIPVSKMSIGCLTGGIDYAGKNQPKEKKNNFGGGGGTGLSVVPVCFVVIHTDGRVEILNVKSTKTGPDPVGDVVGLIERSPELIAKFRDAFGKKDEAPEEDIEL